MGQRSGMENTMSTPRAGVLGSSAWQRGLEPPLCRSHPCRRAPELALMHWA